MKTKLLLLLGLIVILGSCSSAYRTGQTPDDVYYSPAPAQDVYVTSNSQDEKDSYAYNNSGYNSEDMQIRRGIRDPRYRSNVNIDFGYGYQDYGYYNPYAYNIYGSYNHYGYGYNSLYYNPYNSYSSNFYVSPYYDYYYYPQVYVYPGSGAASHTIAPRRYNLGAYTNNTNTSISNNGYRPAITTPTTSAPIRTISTTPSNGGVTTPVARSSRNGVGNFIRRVFTPENNTNNNNNNNRVYRSENNNTNNTYNNSNSSPTRSTQSSSPSSSSSSSSSGSSSAPVRTFRK